MHTPAEEERMHLQACYAVAMHLHANKKVGKAWFAIGIVGIAAAAIFQNLWFIAGAIGLAIATYLYITQSCIRFVTQQTGMPPDVQAAYSRKYKTSPEFARDVDKLLNGDKKFV